MQAQAGRLHLCQKQLIICLNINKNNLKRIIIKYIQTQSMDFQRQTDCQPTFKTPQYRDVIIIIPVQPSLLSFNYPQVSSNSNSKQSNCPQQFSTRPILQLLPSKSYLPEINKLLEPQSLSNGNTQENQEEEEEEMGEKDKKKKNVVLSGKFFKNYLNCIRHCFLRLIERQLTEGQFDAKIFLNKQTNLAKFTSMFACTSLRKPISKIFMNGKLKRELLISKARAETKHAFINKVQVLKEGFLRAHLTNL